MASELKFDLVKLEEVKKKCETTKADLLETKKTLEGKLEKLKADWHTKAGIEFFSKTDTSWAQQADNYAKITQGIADLLGCAIAQYSEVEQAAKALKLKKN